jgi:serine/threonine protein phosphatase PrpC
MNSVRSVFSFTDKGIRKLNEDAIYPTSSNIDSDIYIVCDGVGGATKGDIASKLTIEVMSQAVENNSKSLDKLEFQNIIYTCEEQINKFETANQDAIGMATTLAFVYFDKSSVSIGHIGDSRVYHLRGQNVISLTRDHTLVEELVDAQIIQRSEADHHPQKNVITNAISGVLGKAKLSYLECKDIEQGDILFLCTDGVYNALDTEVLIYELSRSDINYSEISDNIFNICRKYSKDNFSAIAILIEDIVY